MLGRVEQKSRGRVKAKPETHIRIVSATKSTTLLTVTFDQPVVLRGTPAWTTNLAGPTAQSAEATSLNVVQITFSATIASATDIYIPVADPAIRTKRGGYVADTTFQL